MLKLCLQIKLKIILSFTEWFETIIDEHEKSFNENSIRDFIDAFIQEKRKGKDPSFNVMQESLVIITIENN